MSAEDSRTTEDLFQASLQGDYDDEGAWDAVHVLRIRGTDEVFRLAVHYTQSADALERARGLDVLAQLGAGRPTNERPHVDASVTIAIESLQDFDPLVVNSAAWALAHLGGDGAVSALIPMRTNPDPDIRWAVANGLNGSERPDAISAIIELMDDPDDNVRDWATFALGTQCDVDSETIREALRKRLDDQYDKARDEALWGLAQRKDEQGLKMLIERLDADHWIAGDEMAAAETLNAPPDTPVEQLLDGLRKLLGDYFPR
jgi:HEAT repeat protein